MAFEDLTARHATMWGSAPFEKIAGTIGDMQVALVERLAPVPGEEWLDLGCGVGDVAFHAARAGTTVTGSDLSPALIDISHEGENGVEMWGLFRDNFGPAFTLWTSLDAERRAELDGAMVEFFESRRSGDEISYERRYILVTGVRN